MGPAARSSSAIGTATTFDWGVLVVLLTIAALQGSMNAKLGGAIELLEKHDTLIGKTAELATERTNANEKRISIIEQRLGK